MNENKYPNTIKNPDAFNKKLPSGFDGVFDWSFTKGCFGNTKIEPMDFDGVVERFGHYLIFETKEIGKSILKGQEITLCNLQNPKSFTVIKIWGKSSPEYCTLIYPNGKEQEFVGQEDIRQRICDWFDKVDKGLFKQFLRRNK